jgi:hypothetical protein
VEVEALELYSWGSLRDWTKATTVAIVEVTGEQEVPGSRDATIPGEPKEVFRNLDLRVERVVAGRKPSASSFAMRDFGWVFTETGERRPLVHEQTRLEVGDRALVALSGAGQFAEQSGLFTADSVLFLEGGEVSDTTRDKPIIRELEALSEQELIARAERESRGDR